MTTNFKAGQVLLEMPYGMAKRLGFFHTNTNRSPKRYLNISKSGRDLTRRAILSEFLRGKHLMWPDILEDIIDYVRVVVRHTPAETTERISNQSSIRETSLDDALVTAVAKFAAPKRLPSNMIVTIQVHNIGGQ